MLDIQLLRKDVTAVAVNLQQRGYTLDVAKFQELEQQRKEWQIRAEDLQHQRNSMSKQIGLAKAEGKDPATIMRQVAAIADELKAAEVKQESVQADLHAFLLDIPNMLHESVPEGTDESQNREVRAWGKIPEFNFTPKEHFELAPCETGCMDFATSARISGARFVVLGDQIAKLQRVLAQFMLDLHTQEHGYTEKYVPFLVKPECLYGTGQFPKFMDDQYGTANDMWLIPTAEVSLTNLVREQILTDQQLPLKFVAHTPCFRKESGTYGKDTKGMLRQHQFEKVELVQVVHPSLSYQALEALLGHAERVLQLLELPYKVTSLCSGDIGFSAAKTYDLEVWLPGQNAYREISSCSNTESFQARRMQARWRNPTTKKPELVHTLNGSGLAVGRTLIAVLENYQQADGRVQIPKVLRKYFADAEYLGG